MENKCKYLYELGYSEEQINGHLQRWNEGIISYLGENSDNVLENMKYISSYFDSSLLLKLSIFYSDTFVLSPHIFKERFDMLKNEFPQDFVDIVEKQFLGYDGSAMGAVDDDSLYIPYMASMSRGDQQIYKAIESIKNPHTRMYEFIVMLEKYVGINVLPEDIGEDILLDLEVSKWEVVHNAEYLVEKGLAVEQIEDILCYCPFAMMGSTGELEMYLVEAVGDDYVDAINEMSNEEFWIDKLCEIV